MKMNALALCNTIRKAEDGVGKGVERIGKDDKAAIP